MPQLSPLNWLASFFLILTFALSLAATFWWRQNLTFPTLKNSYTPPLLSKPWPW
nr:ATP synthase F0 subunit 8 [Cirriformia sp.]